MARSKFYTLIMTLMLVSGTMSAQDYFDDVYYNPKKDKSTVTVSTASKSTSTTYKTPAKSNYISDMSEMDVDAYNRRGEQYYVTQIDTIGNGIENGEDFVYTQQIQKYYNPTIVVDNASVLGDVLSNAYGNVDIVINNNGYPVFAPYYGWNWSYYNSIWSPWSWGVNIGPWGWSIGWNSPWYAWGWGPGWWNPGPAWGPGWGPAWGPAWRPGWGPAPGPGWGPAPGPAPRPMASWNPRGNQAGAPRPGWSAATQHRGNMAMQPNRVGNLNQGNANVGNHRVPTNVNNGRPVGVVNNNGKWQYNTNTTGNHRAPVGTVNSSSSKPGTSTGTHRTPTTTSKSNVNTNKTSTTPNRNVSNSRTPNRSTGSFSTGSSGAGRSTGGGSRGGGGGRHR